MSAWPVGHMANEAGEVEGYAEDHLANCPSCQASAAQDAV
jgi:hypothetical protein